MRPKRTSAPAVTTFANLFEKFAADAIALGDEQNSADDLRQSAVLYHLEHSEQFDGQTASYIRQRCFWEMQDALGRARQYARQAVPFTQCAADSLISDEPSPEDIIIARETESESKALVIRLLECCVQLPDRQRQVIQLLAQGQRQHEIAARLNISRPAVQQCLTRARVTLRAQLNLAGPASVLS